MTRQQGTDATSIQRATRVITAQITAAAAALIVLIVVTSILFIIDQEQPRELLEQPKPGETKVYIDANAILVALIVVALIAVVFAGLLSWIIARRAVRPLGDALRIQRTFVADASHELRTPVAVVGARAEVLQQQIDAGQRTDQTIADLKTDISVLGDIINDLLQAASPPADTEISQVVNVRELVQLALSDLQILADEHSVTFQLTSDHDIKTHVPQSSLRRCIIALIDNAIRHSPETGVIEVDLARQDRSSFIMTVTDHGAGITGIDPNRVFERFARGDSAAASGRRTSFGIGLALIRDIADRYNGSITVTKTSSSGTTFALRMPMAQHHA